MSTQHTQPSHTYLANWTCHTCVCMFECMRVCPCKFLQFRWLVKISFVGLSIDISSLNSNQFLQFNVHYNTLPNDDCEHWSKCCIFSLAVSPTTVQLFFTISVSVCCDKNIEIVKFFIFLFEDFFHLLFRGMLKKKNIET